MNVFDVEASFSLNIDEFERAMKQAEKNIKTVAGVFKNTAENIDRISNPINRHGDAVNNLGDEYKKTGDKMSDAIDDASDEIKDSFKEIETSSKKTNRNQEELAETAKRSSRDFADNWDKAGEAIEKMADRVKTAISAITTIAASAVATASTAITAIVSQSTAAYANYEQLAGGVETLFKGSADKVKAYANAAYKTAGISVNKYMETVTSFSASLLQGLGGDTEKAADLANQAIIDMSDNANKMGTDISMIQNAYQGFAKQNFVLLDNLKLGYGGTQAEMARLINKSGVLGDTIEVTAETVNDVSFDKIIEAIHVIQTEMGLTGTTAAEAADTISGSAGSMKAAWENLMVEIAKDDGNISQKIDEFAASAETAFNNAYSRISQVVSNIANLIIDKLGLSDEFAEIKSNWDELSSTLSSKIDSIKTNVFDPIASWATNEAIPAAFNVLSGAFNVLKSAIEYLEPIAVSFWNNFLKPLKDWAGDKVVDLLNSLGDALNYIADDPVIVEHLTNIAVAIVGLKVASSVITGIQTLGTALVTLGTNAKMALAGMSGLTKVFAVVGAAVAGWEIGSLIYEKFEDEINGVLWPIFDEVVSWWENIKSFFTEDIPAFLASVGDWFSEKWEGIKAIFSGVAEFFSNAFTGAKNGIINAFSAVSGWFSERWNEIKGVFSTVSTFFSEKFNAAKTSIENAFSNIGAWFGEKWQSIKDTFSNVGGWFGEKFGEAYDKIKEKFENIKNFFSGIWDEIKGIFSTIGHNVGEAVEFAFVAVLNGAIAAIETALNLIPNAINGAIKAINALPGVDIEKIPTVSLPRLADGGVLTGEQLFIGGEYPGARMNPEIVTPQNIMRDTFEDVLNRRKDGVTINIYNTINAENPEDENFGQRVLDKIVEALEDNRIAEIVAQGGKGW